MKNLRRSIDVDRRRWWTSKFRLCPLHERGWGASLHGQYRDGFWMPFVILCYISVGEFPLQIGLQCAQFAKIGVSWKIVQNKHPICPKVGTFCWKMFAGPLNRLLFTTATFFHDLGEFMNLSYHYFDNLFWQHGVFTLLSSHLCMFLNLPIYHSLSLSIMFSP